MLNVYKRSPGNRLTAVIVLVALVLPSSISANEKGLRALATLVELTKKEHRGEKRTDLNITVNAGEVDGQRIYYFLSGYELFSESGNIIQLSVLGLNEVLFEKGNPEWKKVPPTVLLAGFPLLPEINAKVLDILGNTTDLNVKVALTVALRRSVFLSSDTVNYLAEQLASSSGDLQLATLFALMPTLRDHRFARLSNFDLKPVIVALSNLPLEEMSILSVLMIEATLSRSPYLVYFGIMSDESKRLLERTAQVHMNSRLEIVRNSFRRQISVD